MSLGASSRANQVFIRLRLYGCQRNCCLGRCSSGYRLQSKIHVSESKPLEHVGGARRSFLLDVSDRRAIAKWLAANSNLSAREIRA